MKISTTFYLILTGFIFLPAPSIATQNTDEGPQLNPYLDHWFFSTRANHRNHQRLFYYVCNQSESNSALRWEGAGFGITAFAELKPGICAFKNTYTESTSSHKPHNVAFQGGSSGEVVTWSPDVDGDLLSNIYTYIETVISDPDGFVEHSIISTRIEVREDGSGEMTVASSGKFQDVVISFPGASEVLQDIVDKDVGDATIEYVELGNAYEQAADDSLNLSDDISPQSKSIRLIPTESLTFETTIELNDVSAIGPSISIFGGVNGQLTVRNDLLLTGS